MCSHTFELCALFCDLVAWSSAWPSTLRSHLVPRASTLPLIMTRVMNAHSLPVLPSTQGHLHFLLLRTVLLQDRTLMNRVPGSVSLTSVGEPVLQRSPVGQPHNVWWFKLAHYCLRSACPFLRSPLPAPSVPTALLPPGRVRSVAREATIAGHSKLGLAPPGGCAQASRCDS
jgi:hypothetical protein